MRSGGVAHCLVGCGGASGEATYGLGSQRPRFNSGLVLQQVRELECLYVVLDALDEVGLAVEQPVLLEEGAHERLRLVEVGGGHHGEEVVLRLQRDVAGEHLG